MWLAGDGSQGMETGQAWSHVLCGCLQKDEDQAVMVSWFVSLFCIAFSGFAKGQRMRFGDWGWLARFCRDEDLQPRMVSLFVGASPFQGVVISHSVSDFVTGGWLRSSEIGVGQSRRYRYGGRLGMISWICWHVCNSWSHYFA